MCYIIQKCGVISAPIIKVLSVSPMPRRSIIEQYISVVKPMYHQFIEPTKRYADVVIPEGVTNTVAIDLINTKVASILKESQKA